MQVIWHGVITTGKHFPHYWPFVRGIQQSLLYSSHKGQQCRALLFSLMLNYKCCWTNSSLADDLRLLYIHVTWWRFLMVVSFELVCKLHVSLTWKCNEVSCQILKAGVGDCLVCIDIAVKIVIHWQFEFHSTLILMLTFRWSGHGSNSVYKLVFSFDKRELHIIYFLHF